MAFGVILQPGLIALLIPPTFLLYKQKQILFSDVDSQSVSLFMCTVKAMAAKTVNITEKD